MAHFLGYHFAFENISHTEKSILFKVEIYADLD